ncbi:MAG: hypothetical protein ACOC5B_00805 [Myxococcota bacterium]
MFESKLEVFEALLEIHHAEIQRRIETAVAETHDPREQIAASVEALFRWHAGLGPIGRILDAVARAPDTPVSLHRGSTLHFAADLWEAQLRQQLGCTNRPVLRF